MSEKQNKRLRKFVRWEWERHLNGLAGTSILYRLRLAYWVLRGRCPKF